LVYYNKLFSSFLLTYTQVINYELAIGIVKIKVLPSPTSLSTQILPPCFSTNSLQIIKPKPEPFSFSVPSVVISLSILKSVLS